LYTMFEIGPLTAKKETKCSSLPGIGNEKNTTMLTTKVKKAIIQDG